MEEINENLQKLKFEENNQDLITLEVTVPTGFESVAVHEIIEKLNVLQKDIISIPGRLYFQLYIEDYPKVETLRSVDNISLFVNNVPKIEFKDEQDWDFNQIKSILDHVDLVPAVKKWAKLTKFSGNILPTKAEHDTARVKQDKVFNNLKTNTEFDRSTDEYKHDVLKYRVTCERTGPKQSFTSNDAALKFGGEMNDRLNWIVALSDWNLNVLLRIQHASAMVLLKITIKSMHRRCLYFFGPTSLRPTIAFSMLHLAELKPGDHLVDPLCGGGSIPIECMHGFSRIIISCGDIHDKAVARCLDNINAQKEKNLYKADVFRWNTNTLPFKNHEIDAIVTDLPFGKRSGSKRNNATFYKQLISEFSRVLRLGTGRLVVLTKDTPHLFKALQYKDPKSIWYISKILTVNVGALKCAVVVAWRRKKYPRAISSDN